MSPYAKNSSLFRPCKTRFVTQSTNVQVIPDHNCQALDASECWKMQKVKLPPQLKKKNRPSIIESCCVRPKDCSDYIKQKRVPDDADMEFKNKKTRVNGDLRNCMQYKRSNCDDATEYCMMLDMLPRDRNPVEIVTVKNKASLCCTPASCLSHANEVCALKNLPVKSKSPDPVSLRQFIDTCCSKEITCGSRYKLFFSLPFSLSV